MNQNKTTVLHIFVISALVALIYSNTLGVPFQGDDTGMIVINPIIKNLVYFEDTDKARGYVLYSHFMPRYIGYLTFALNYKANGLDVAGYHIVNIIIHLLNSILIYILVRLTLRASHMPDTPASRSIAFFTALIFGVHPVGTQSVTYIVQRLTSLAAFFYLSSLVLYVQYRLSEVVSGRRRLIRPALYILSLLCAALSMRTKEIAFTLPAIIVIYEFIFFEGRPARRIFILIPFILAFAIIPLTLLYSNHASGNIFDDISKASRLETEMSRLDYMFTEFRVIATYLRLLILPINQMLDYDYPIYRSILNVEVFFSFCLLAGILFSGFYFLKLSTKNKLFKFLSFGIFWFFVTLSVESSFIPIVDVIFEHRLYLPSIGFMLFGITGIFMAGERFFKEGGARYASIFLLAAALIFSIAAYARNAVWKTPLLLWQDNYKNAPGKARVNYNLGESYYNIGQIDKALEHYQTAVFLDPAYVKGHQGLGKIYLDFAMFDEAIESLKKAVQAEPGKSASHRMLCAAYFKKGLLDRAVETCKTAISVKPDDYEAQYSLATAYSFMGQTDLAISHYKFALAVKPDYIEAYYNLSADYLRKGNTDEAIRNYKIAISLKPDSPELHINIAGAYIRAGNFDMAIEHGLRAVSLSPDNARANLVIGKAYEGKGIKEKAREYFAIAKKIDPSLK